MGSIHKFISSKKGGIASIFSGVVPPSYFLKKAIGKKNFDTLHPMGTQAEAQLDARKVSEKALKTAETETPIPLPDDEEIQRNARRAASRRQGSGRESTFMSSNYGFGG